MNSPNFPQNKQPAPDERVARLEVVCERILDELREMKGDMREMRREITLARTVDFRILFGALIASDITIIGVVASGFGSI